MEKENRKDIPAMQPDGRDIPMYSQWLADRPAVHVLGTDARAGSADAVLARTGKEVQSAREGGFLPENIFYCAPFDDDVSQVANLCRFVAGSMEDLRFLDRKAQQSGTESIFKVGLRLQMPALPRLENAFMPDELTQYAHELRSMRHLTVRGCFFSADLAGVHGRELGSFFRAGYETAKRMTVTIPCAMPYLCYENAAAAIRENLKRRPETAEDCLRALDILIMQNETAFYAKLFVS